MVDKNTSAPRGDWFAGRDAAIQSIVDSGMLSEDGRVIKNARALLPTVEPVSDMDYGNNMDIQLAPTVEGERDVRVMFEQYAAAQGYKDFEQNEFGDYSNPNMNGLWTFWQAALRTRPAESKGPHVVVHKAMLAELQERAAAAGSVPVPLERLQWLRAAINHGYGNLPKDSPPGPPTTILASLDELLSAAPSGKAGGA